MDNGIKRIFDVVRADEALRESSYAVVCREIAARRGTDGRSKTRVRAAVKFAAGCAAAFVVMLGVNALYFDETSFVSIDVNPSVELGLNRFDRVVSVSAYNDDAAEIIRELPLINKPYASAVTLVLRRVESAGYISGDAYVEFTVQSHGGELREQSILSGLHGCASELKATARVEISAVDEDTRAQAHSNGMTAGKYRASLELQSLDTDVTLDDCKSYSIGEIKKRTDECHAAHGNGNGGNGSGGNGSGGNGSGGNGNGGNGNGGNGNGGNGSGGNGGHRHGGRHDE